MSINSILEKEFNIKAIYVSNIIELIDAGNTIPFIARYRKELTASLDDQILREFSDRLIYLRNLEDRRKTIIETIEEQEKMTDELLNKINNTFILTELEDIYRPFRPKRRTRATVAKERGLEPLALYLFEQKEDGNLDSILEKYIDIEKELENKEEVLEGAKDIIAEMISDDADIRKIIRNETFNNGVLQASASNEDNESVYEMYYEYSEKIKFLANHRVLAINRGEKEKFLTVKIIVNVERVSSLIANKVIIKNSPFQVILEEIIDDSYKRLIAPSIEREIRSELSEKAEEAAIKVFGENLKQLLLQAPMKDKVVLALDPAFRTGCKLAVIDEIGKVLDTTVIFPTAPQNKVAESEKVLEKLIKKFNVNIIAIGNGTASRESEQFVADLIKKLDKKIPYIIVNEAGASVYSASKLAASEFPDFDVSLRSAVSIARRLQDPLAELVKIDPKAIGVGQYQHDMNQKRLEQSLGAVVESSVNTIGVDLNTASSSLLSYVAGLSNRVSQNIVLYREENGKFFNRKELSKVPQLGPKTFLQAAGFLRIAQSENVFDNTAVHPESYKVAEKLINSLELDKNKLDAGVLSKTRKNDSKLLELSEKLEIGIPTLKDILEELERPGRDMRDDMPQAILRSDILEIEDIEEGMILTGTVRNVIDFGAFIDIGVGQDGLVHISELSDSYIKHPLDALSVADIVKVKVIGIDIARNRISLSMKGLN